MALKVATVPVEGKHFTAADVSAAPEEALIKAPITERISDHIATFDTSQS